MKDVFKDFLRFVWRRDSESACILIIGLSWWLGDADLRQMSDYLQALLDSNKSNHAIKGRDSQCT
jgi:hypothetical protein